MNLVRQSSVFPVLWQAIPVMIRLQRDCWATSRRRSSRRALQVYVSCTCFSCCVCTISRQLIVIAVPQIIDVIKVIPEEWMSKQIVQQIVDVPVSKILVEIVEPVAYRRQATARVDVRGAGR